MPNETTTDRVCKECGDVFTMTDAEIDFFLQKGLSIPKRCPGCRELRRQQAVSPTEGQ